MEYIDPPYTKEQVRNLNAYQRSGLSHSYTCGSGNRTDKYHLDGEGILVATTDGLHCPFCNYEQPEVFDGTANFNIIETYEQECPGFLEATYKRRKEKFFIYRKLVAILFFQDGSASSLGEWVIAESRTELMQKLISKNQNGCMDTAIKAVENWDEKNNIQLYGNYVMLEDGEVSTI